MLVNKVFAILGFGVCGLETIKAAKLRSNNDFLYFYRPNHIIMNRLRIFALIAACWLCSCQLFAQDGVSIGNWRTHLPYLNVNDVELLGKKAFAATDYELFYYDTEDNSIHILNKVNGLSDIGVSTIRYNQSQQKLFVAYTNCNVDLIDKNLNIKNMSDIKDKSILGNKTINNVFFDGDLAYVACGFGIVVFDMKREEVKDTYYIGNQGSAVNVTDIAIFNGRIYACSDDGVYYASLDAQNLANYASWHFDNSLIHPHFEYTEMEVFNGKLYLNYDGGFDQDTVFVYDGYNWSRCTELGPSQIRQMRAVGDELVVTYRYYVTAYDSNLNQALLIYSPGGAIVPWATTVDGEGNYWIGDSKRGMVKTSDGWNNMDVLPNGTASKNVFELKSGGGQVWLATGGHAANWGKVYMIDGVARYDGMWTILNRTTNPDLDAYSDFVCTATNPNDPSVTYVGTWGYGVLKFKDDELVEVYNAENSTLQPWNDDPTLTNISGLGFDSKGNLWVANTGAPHLLSVMEPNGTWHSYNLGGGLSNIHIGVMLIDKNDYKWIIRRSGAENKIIVFNDNGTIDNPADDQVVTLNNTANAGNLPGAVNCIAVDGRGYVWVGTDNGPCYFGDSRKLFSSESYSATCPLVERNDGTGLSDPLFANSSVLSMAVDGGDNIWFGLESGVYLLKNPTSSRPTQLHFFNTDNSPLLENSVTTMAISDDGEVFFGTSSGVISYRGEVTPPDPTPSNIIAYPNPVRPGYSGYVGIKGLAYNSLVRITAADGAFVTELLSDGGQAVWDCTTVDGRKVSPGVYLIYASTKDGEYRLATKILIMN